MGENYVGRGIFLPERGGGEWGIEESRIAIIMSGYVQLCADECRGNPRFRQLASGVWGRARMGRSGATQVFVSKGSKV
eukprot:1393030-Amorphochlora_amoeboformis.AAC.3